MVSYDCSLWTCSHTGRLALFDGDIVCGGTPQPDYDSIGGCNYEGSDWDVSIGFKKLSENPLFSRLDIGGVNNAVVISEGIDGIDGTVASLQINSKLSCTLTKKKANLKSNKALF